VRQKLVVSEMKHRIKNSLATIQAIATQTLNRAEERDAFIARLHDHILSSSPRVACHWWTRRQPTRRTRIASPFFPHVEALVATNEIKLVTGLGALGGI